MLAENRTGMQKSHIGKTSLEVTKLSFGCSSIGNLYQQVTDARAEAVLFQAWQAGIRYFDTAPHYGRGLSEERLGKFLRHKPRENYVISTKVGRVLKPSPVPIAEADGFIAPLQNAVHYDYSGDGILESFEQSCQRLCTKHVEILYVHDLGVYNLKGVAERHMQAFLGSGYEQLVQLKETGRIQAFGLGVNEVQVCLDVMDFGAIDVIMLAGRLTLLDRSAEAVLVPRCMSNGTSLVLAGIFNSGILAKGPVEGVTYDYGPAPPAILTRVQGLKEQAESVGLSLPAAALQFAFHHPAASSAVIGTSSADSLKRNLELLSLELPSDVERLFHYPAEERKA
jgi:D-threo-aldose 1-dehydrogenase